MIRKKITYTNLEGEKETATFHFHLTQFEWLELEAYTKGGLIENLRISLETNNWKKTIDLLKKMILRAYMEFDPDTNKFRKDEDSAIDFSKTEAFSTLFYELAYDSEKSQEFFLALIPPEHRDAALKAVKEQTMSEINDTIEPPLQELT